jgi:AbiU2
MKSIFRGKTPIERVDLARTRLPLASSAMGELLELNAQRKTFISSEMFRRNRFDVGVRLLAQTMSLLEVVQICRICDKSEEHGFSLPTLAELLSGAPVRQVLREINSGDGLNVVPLHGSGADCGEFLEVLDEALAEIERISKSEELRRLREFRHKSLAHAVEFTRTERETGEIFEPAPDDIEYAVERSFPALQVIGVVLQARPIDYLEWRVRSLRVLSEFYSRLHLDPALPLLDEVRKLDAAP